VRLRRGLPFFPAQHHQQIVTFSFFSFAAKACFPLAFLLAHISGHGVAVVVAPEEDGRFFVRVYAHTWDTPTTKARKRNNYCIRVIFYFASPWMSFFKKIKKVYAEP